MIEFLMCFKKPKLRYVESEQPSREALVFQAQPAILVGDKLVSHGDIDMGVRMLLSNLSCYGQVALAGGALRDIALGETPSDYDIYTTMPYDRVIAALYNLGVTDIEQLVSGSQVIRGPIYGGPTAYVLEFYIDGVDEPIQLIGLNCSVYDYVTTHFSVGASRCMYVPHVGFSCTHSFLRDVFKKRITIINADTMTHAYLKKLSCKFDTWEIVLCHGLK